MFRPAVPVSLGPKFRRGIVGLVDSGSEHTLASKELADDMGLDLSEATARLAVHIDRPDLLVDLLTATPTIGSRSSQTFAVGLILAALVLYGFAINLARPSSSATGRCR